MSDTSTAEHPGEAATEDHSNSGVAHGSTSRSSIDGTFISETAEIRRQLQTSNWPAFARSPNHEQSYLPRKRQAALMSILLLMVLFMMKVPREDERKRQRQDETKALQIELADQPGGSKKNHVAFTGRRILAILDPKTVEHKLVDSGGMLYTSKECPVLHERHSVAYFREDHTWAHKLAREAEVLETVSKAFSSGILDGRKILFVGDSVMQQVFGSIDCLAQTAGLREESDRDNRDDPNPDHQMHPFYFRTSRGGTDVFYSRFFGQMLKYHGAFGTTPLAEEFQWIESCRRREPFRYGSNIETGDRGIYIGRIEEYSMGGEARTLSPNDFVVIHGTLHRERDENISNMKQLFACMEEARSLGQDPGWPHITVLSTLPQHFHTENGEYSSDGANPAIFDGCRESIDLEKFPPYLEEREIFYGKVPLVGHDLHLEHMGNYHVGKRLDHVKAIDCTHWSMPGVPDFVAKSVLDHIVAMSESHSK